MNKSMRKTVITTTDNSKLTNFGEQGTQADPI